MEKDLLQHGLILLPGLPLVPFILSKRDQRAGSFSRENREKKDGDLIGHRNMAVKITVFWGNDAERLPAQQEPAWISQETGMEETWLI